MRHVARRYLSVLDVPSLFPHLSNMMYSFSRFRNFTDSIRCFVPMQTDMKSAIMKTKMIFYFETHAGHGELVNIRNGGMKLSETNQLYGFLVPALHSEKTES